MKISDIIAESYTGFTGRGKDYGTVKRSDIDQSLPSVMIEPQLRNTDTYMQMRYGIALAAAAARKGEDFEQESAWSENIGMVGYTDAEVEQIKIAEKLQNTRKIIGLEYEYKYIKEKEKQEKREALQLAKYQKQNETYSFWQKGSQLLQPGLVLPFPLECYFLLKKLTMEYLR